MAKRFHSQAEIDAFLNQPRLAILIYNGARLSPVGVPVWYDWDGSVLRMFSGRSSPKVQYLSRDPNVSVLVTNHTAEPEGWVAFDGAITVADFDPVEWVALIDRVAPRYWDMNDPAKNAVIESWRMSPENFVSLHMVPARVRSGA